MHIDFTTYQMKQKALTRQLVSSLKNPLHLDLRRVLPNDFELRIAERTYQWPNIPEKQTFLAFRVQMYTSLLELDELTNGQFRTSSVEHDA